jgi:hypothetical protein
MLLDSKKSPKVPLPKNAEKHVQRRLQNSTSGKHDVIVVEWLGRLVGAALLQSGYNAKPSPTTTPPRVAAHSIAAGGINGAKTVQERRRPVFRPTTP